MEESTEDPEIDSNFDQFHFFCCCCCVVCFSLLISLEIHNSKWKIEVFIRNLEYLPVKTTRNEMKRNGRCIQRKERPKQQQLRLEEISLAK
jgi:hypothetical protein